MKKAFSILLALCVAAGLLAGCAGSKPSAPAAEPTPQAEPAAAPAEAPAPAPAEPPAAEPEELTEYPDCGVDMTAAANSPDITGGILWQSYGSINYSPNVYLLELLYFAMPKADFETSYQQYKDGSISDADRQHFLSVYASIGYLVGSSGSLEETNQAALKLKEPYTATELGTADGYTFWFATEPIEDYLSEVDAEYASECRSLRENLPTLLKGSRFYAPSDPLLSLSGQYVHFETTDLDGNPVSSEELFARNEVTMLNCWATWCGPCKGELGELAELHTRLQAKNCGIIGIVTDGGESAELAKSLIAENGIAYPNVVLSDDMSFMDNISSIPTSIYVGKDGRILTDPIIGAQVDAYEPTVDKLLTGGGSSSKPSAAAGVYRIFVKDTDGKGVQGVKVQFCSDDECRFATTDEAGLASFEAAPAVYSVHVLKTPDGYAKDETEYQTAATPGDLTITLKKS